MRYEHLKPRDLQWDETTDYFKPLTTENNHHCPLQQLSGVGLGSLVVETLWCVYVGQDVPDYQAITGYS